MLKREEREVKGRVFAAFGTPPELGNISEDSASLLRLFRAPLLLRQHCGYNLVLFIPSRMSKYFQPSPALLFPLIFSLFFFSSLSVCAILSSIESTLVCNVLSRTNGDVFVPRQPTILTHSNRLSDPTAMERLRSFVAVYFFCRMFINESKIIFDHRYIEHMFKNLRTT